MSYAPVHVSAPVTTILERDLVVVAHDTSLDDVERVLEGRGISCALVRGPDDARTVVSRTDLLRTLQREAHRPDGAARLPAVAVGALSLRAPICVASGASVSQAAAAMVAERVHRVFVEEAGALIGVVSTFDLLHALVSAHPAMPVDAWMSAPVETLSWASSLGLAIDRLTQAKISALIVVGEGDRPIGILSQREVLGAARRGADPTAEDAMSPAITCVPSGMPLGEAAEQARETRARRVVVMAGRRAKGVLTGLDFARALAARAS